MIDVTPMRTRALAVSGSSTVHTFTSSPSDFHHATPIYERFAGWTEDISGARVFEDLPRNAQAYVLAVEAMSGSRISAIGVGPDREAIVVRHDLLD